MLDLRAFVARTERKLTVVYPQLADVGNNPESEMPPGLTDGDLVET
jgi:hypothetical protein